MNLIVILPLLALSNTNAHSLPASGRQVIEYLTSELRSLAEYIDKVNVSSSRQHEEPAERRDSPDDRCGISVFSEATRYGSLNRIASEGEFPWQVGISLNADLEDMDCAGTIISEQYILTTANCIQDMSDLSDVRITAGRTKYNEPKLMRRAANIITHEDFDSATNNNDIGLIKLSQPFDLNRGVVNSACLPPPDITPDQYVKGELLVTGYAESGDDMEDSRLVASSVPFIDDRTCRSMYRSESLGRVICAGSSRGSSSSSFSSLEGSSSCGMGESGAPLIGRDVNGRAVVLGISSWGYGCSSSGLPTVYTDVRQYINWIVERAI